MATRRTKEEIDREADENRKEALLASAQSLQPIFNRSNLTQKQISKLQVTHRSFTRDVCKLKPIQRSLRKFKQARILRGKQWKMAKTNSKVHTIIGRVSITRGYFSTTLSSQPNRCRCPLRRSASSGAVGGPSLPSLFCFSG